MSGRRRVVLAEPPSAASEVAGNYDLLYQIILRLPVKNLIGCKPVSKQWSSLISDTSRVHHNPSLKLVISGFLFYNSLTKSPKIESVSIYRNNKLPLLQFLDKITQGASVKIVQSVNGLLLCSLVSHFSGYTFKGYCICNPTTSHYRLLPQPENAYQSKILGCSLVFDPSVSLHYIVICVRQFQQHCQIDMFSSENQSWKKCADILQVPWGTSFENGVFWNGGIHWDTYRCALLSYDVSSWSMTNLPLVPLHSEDRKGGSSYFGESNGCLYYIKVPDVCSTEFYVFELRVGDVAWLCRYRVEVSDLVGEFREIRQRTRQRGYNEIVHAYSILHVGERSFVADQGEEEDLSMLLAVPGKVVSYNFVSKKVKVLKDTPGRVVEPFRYYSFAAFGFMESLFHV